MRRPWNTLGGVSIPRHDALEECGCQPGSIREIDRAPIRAWGAKPTSLADRHSKGPRPKTPRCGQSPADLRPAAGLAPLIRWVAD